jgi:hypothetical protein
LRRIVVSAGGTSLAKCCFFGSAERARHVALQLGRDIWKAAACPPACVALQDAPPPPAFAGAGPRRVGLKLRMPSRTKVPFIRFTMRVRSPTRHSRSRFGRLASSSAIVGTRAMLQWPRSPRSHPKNPRFSNSVSSRSVFARRCSRDTATLEGWMTCASTHAHSANAPTRSRRGRLRRQAQSA